MEDDSEHTQTNPSRSPIDGPIDVEEHTYGPLDLAADLWNDTFGLLLRSLIIAFAVLLAIFGLVGGISTYTDLSTYTAWYILVGIGGVTVWVLSTRKVLIMNDVTWQQIIFGAISAILLGGVMMAAFTSMEVSVIPIVASMGAVYGVISAIIWGISERYRSHQPVGQ